MFDVHFRNPGLSLIHSNTPHWSGQPGDGRTQFTIIPEPQTIEWLPGSFAWHPDLRIIHHPEGRRRRHIHHWRTLRPADAHEVVQTQFRALARRLRDYLSLLQTGATAQEEV